MTPENIIWAAPTWLLPTAILVAATLLVLAWSYLRVPAGAGVRSCAALLKALGVIALAICLIEPLFSGSRPRPGANLFIMLADNSQSLQMRDTRRGPTRGEVLQKELARDSNWRTRLGQDFDVRHYLFDTRLRAVADFAEIKFDGAGSTMVNSLETIARRYHGRPLAGVLLLTDGNATDLTTSADATDWSELPPVYPVIVGSDEPPKDLGVDRVTVTQTNFEAAPVTVRAEINAHGYEDENIVVQLLDDDGKEVGRQLVTADNTDEPLAARFQLRPEKAGISFYTVRTIAEEEEKAAAEASPYDNANNGKDSETRDTSEATLENNRRSLVVDRGGGPYRVLYVSGRPNWEFKFLRRAIEEDHEVELVGLVRIARREPKFEFRSRSGESTNPLFRGFDNKDDEDAEQYDQPVLLRLGTRDKAELRDGFPKAADLLYQYHAIILDDLDAEFFTQDQMSLLEQFVNHRGGGLLMLGGMESFARGGYNRTPVGELLPVYLDRLPKTGEAHRYQLLLTREGWLQPWVRLRNTEPDEHKRLGAMPKFATVNRVRGIKPGATVLARVRKDPQDTAGQPALVAQRYGEGRAAALLVGDLWRWALRREPDEQRDLEKAWRQTVRWLVADVPASIEIDARRNTGQPGNPIELQIEVHDEQFEPLDNARVKVVVTPPDGEPLEVDAEPSDAKGGTYVATYVPRAPGTYRAKITVTAADGSEVGEKLAGWTAQPAADEFRQLAPNRKLLEQIAEKTGGEVLQIDGLDDFVAGLSTRKIPVTEPWIYPLWHQPFVFLFAIVCLCAEWGLRRWKGLP